MIDNLSSILTQSSLGTADPIYLVYSKEPIFVDGDFYYDETKYYRETFDTPDELSCEVFEKLETAYYLATDYRRQDFDINGEIIYEHPIDPFEDKEFDPTEWISRRIKYIDKFEQAFFIRQNAEDFIAANSHRLTRPYIFVESGYQNHEWRAIRQMLLDKAQAECNNVAV